MKIIARGSFWPSIIITGNGNLNQIISHINADVKTPSTAGPGAAGGRSDTSGCFVNDDGCVLIPYTHARG